MQSNLKAFIRLLKLFKTLSVINRLENKGTVEIMDLKLSVSDSFYYVKQ